jgi:hypothetical protein
MSWHKTRYSEWAKSHFTNNNPGGKGKFRRPGRPAPAGAGKENNMPVHHVPAIPGKFKKPKAEKGRTTMKKQIFGRKVGSGEAMTLLIEGGGFSTGGKKVDPGVIDEIAVASARRAVQALREKSIEGYVLFEGDPTRYEFSPDGDFVYPSTVH